MIWVLGLKVLLLEPGEEAWLPDYVEEEVFPDSAKPARAYYSFAPFLPEHRLKKVYKRVQGGFEGEVKVVPYRGGTDTAVVFSLIPYDCVVDGKIGGFYIGRYPDPYRRGRRSVALHPERYLPPKGFIEVTPEVAKIKVSEHFTVGDYAGRYRFITFDPKIFEVLERIIDTLQAMGLPSKVKIISGYRPPAVNARRRKRFSRHQYGDAADIIVDANDDGRMDDLNGDGRINRRDAQFLAKIAEGVLHSMGLEGGIGYYRGRRRGTPFIHVDIRGFKARWRR